MITSLRVTSLETSFATFWTFSTATEWLTVVLLGCSEKRLANQMSPRTMTHNKTSVPLITHKKGRRSFLTSLLGNSASPDISHSIAALLVRGRFRAFSGEGACQEP